MSLPFTLNDDGSLVATTQDGNELTILTKDDGTDVDIFFLLVSGYLVRSPSASALPFLSQLNCAKQVNKHLCSWRTCQPAGSS
jgi:hypothetical protein